MGQGITSGEITHLNGIFTPGILPNRVPSPPDLPKPPQAVCWGLLRGNIQNPNHQPNRWASALGGSLKELNKNHTLNTLDPYDNDDAVLHNDDAKDHLLRKAHDTNGSLLHTRGIVKDATLGKSSLSTDRPTSCLIT